VLSIRNANSASPVPSVPMTNRVYLMVALVPEKERRVQSYIFGCMYNVLAGLAIELQVVQKVDHHFRRRDPINPNGASKHAGLFFILYISRCCKITTIGEVKW